MQVFILCTGRSGSVGLIKACAHIDNYTSAHESLARQLGSARLDYPQAHIEADNRLGWFLGALDEKYGDSAFYVHLQRERAATARSFMQRWYGRNNIVSAFANGILLRPPELLSEADRYQVCLDYCDTVNTNIRQFLQNKSRKMDMHLENIQADFPIFWERIGAQGNLEDALQTFDTPQNPSSRKMPKNYAYHLKLAALRFWQQLKA